MAKNSFQIYDTYALLKLYIYEGVNQLHTDDSITTLKIRRLMEISPQHDDSRTNKDERCRKTVTNKMEIARFSKHFTSEMYA